MVRCFWVDFLSPATYWSGFGSTLVPLFYQCCDPVYYYLGSLLVWRIGIWGNGLRTVFGGFRWFGALFGGLWKPVVSHHAQI
jgi:hypothetical protein